MLGQWQGLMITSSAGDRGGINERWVVLIQLMPEVAFLYYTVHAGSGLLALDVAAPLLFLPVQATLAASY